MTGLNTIICKRELPGSAFILRFERNGLIFTPGQYIYVGILGDDDRPYSIYSGIDDNYLEILVKEVDNGNISAKLKQLEPGEKVNVGNPCGSFTMESDILKERNFWLIATGTGISPFHCFIRSFPILNYRIIHGIRYHYEAFDKEFYGKNYLCCTTGDSLCNFSGRVTDYLRAVKIDKSAFYYLCGNYNMIDDVYDLLTTNGIESNQIKTEGYF